MRGRYSVIIYIILAIVILFLISRSSKNKPNASRRNRRLRIRSNFTHPADPHERASAAAFDPVIADLERKREDKEWEQHYFQTHQSDPTHSAPGHESQPEWEDFMDADDYLNDEERFNVTNRLVTLFPKIDVDPPDGYVSEAELTSWNVQMSQREVAHRTDREMEVHDKNRDGFVSFAEYDPPNWATKSGGESFGYDIGWWKEEHFNASDADGDGLLNITEFNDFLHPADTNNTMLLQWLCKEEIRERDSNKDGKVEFKEFFHGLFDLIRNYDDVGHSFSHESGDSVEPPAKALFKELDTDGDGYLTDLELLPIISKIHPPESHYAKQQTEYTMHQADTDKDGRLTLEEMIENPYAFYGSVYDEDGEDEYGYHDEFR